MVVLRGASADGIFKLLRNRFPDWWVGTTTLFVVPARQATWAGGIDS
jgi:hypothetical protein